MTDSHRAALSLVEVPLLTSGKPARQALLLLAVKHKYATQPMQFTQDELGIGWLWFLLDAARDFRPYGEELREALFLPLGHLPRKKHDPNFERV